MTKENNEGKLKAIWNNVWNESGVQSYSNLRLFKTKDKIRRLVEVGVDFNNKRVLDIGCGEGTALFYLQEHFNVSGIGVDIYKEVIAKNKSKAKRNNKIQFFVGNHKSLDLPSNEFDIVLSWGVVEHSKEYIQALAEARRVLKKDGTLVLIQPNS